eukprot:m.271497 g.271497  ORF g.271497 m.271497 type:complete len:59 (-) comp17671_c2_seq6:184-360(-)
MRGEYSCLTVLNTLHPIKQALQLVVGALSYGEYSSSLQLSSRWVVLVIARLVLVFGRC